MKEKTVMDKITEEMMEHVCDKICRFPWMISDQEEMNEICAGCEMKNYVGDILYSYSKLREWYRWIPVGEQLPEESEMVLVAGRFDDIQVAYWDKQKWYLAINRRPYNYGPLAWMPLPEKYQLPVLTEAGEPAGNYAGSDTLASAT